MKARKQERSLALLAIIAAVWVIAGGVYARQEPKPANPAGAGVSAVKTPDKPESLTATEFSRLIRELSESGGYFRSDNFTSNETAYLTVVDTLRQLGASGGAYLGVGPEQNFSYIAKIRPQIAFSFSLACLAGLCLRIRRRSPTLRFKKSSPYSARPPRMKRLTWPIWPRT